MRWPFHTHPPSLDAVQQFYFPGCLYPLFSVTSCSPASFSTLLVSSFPISVSSLFLFSSLLLWRPYHFLKTWSPTKFNYHCPIDNLNMCLQWFYSYSFLRHCFHFLSFASIPDYNIVKQITLSGEITNKRINQLFICAFLCIATAKIQTPGLLWVLISIYFYTLIKISQHFGMNICVLCNWYGVKNRWP